jgi:hypothetical protein
MKRRFSVPITIIGSLIFSTGIALAAPRDITAKIGGKANEVFKIVGGLIVKSIQVDGNIQANGNIYRGKRAGAGDNNPLVIADDLTVTGSITSNKLPVSGTKWYTGTFDTTASGDVVIDSVGTTDCTTAPGTYMKSTHTHWKKIAVPEVKVATLPEIRMYIKPYFTPVTAPSVNPLASITDLWAPASSINVSPGYVYYFYKATTELCNGTITPSYFTTGEYQILVQ